MQNMQKANAVLINWAKDHNMLINKEKSAIILFNTTNKQDIPQDLNYPVTNKYKYLGMLITD
jgi:hypothetical protein